MTNLSQLKTAKTELSKVLQEFNDFGGIGEATLDGERCLVVYVDESVEVRDQHEIPSAFNGIKVITRLKHGANFL